MKKKKLFRNNSLLSAIIISVATGIFLSVILTLICAKVLTMYDISHSLLMYFWIAIAVISGFFTGITAGKLSKSRSIIWGSLAAMTVSLINILILCISSSFVISFTIFSILPSYILPGAVGAVIASNLK